MFKLFTRNAAPINNNLLAEAEARKLRMAEKLERIKEEMGDKYILHPKHNVTKLETPRSY